MIHFYQIYKKFVMFHIPSAELAACMTYRDIIFRVAAQHNLSPAIVAAVGSRESGWGTGSDMTPKGPGGTGDRAGRKPKPPQRKGPLPPDGLGFGRGLMQIDWDWNEFARTGDWKDPASNIDYGCNQLANNVKFFGGKGLSEDNALRAGLAAYNHGAGAVWKNIKNGDMRQVDVGTANNNYSADTLVRAEAYQAAGFARQIAAAFVSASAFASSASVWPAENTPELDRFFGPIELNAEGDLVRGWEETHLTRIECPWPLTLSWDHSQKTRSIRCNKKVSESLSGILQRIWTAIRLELFGDRASANASLWRLF